jgi:hypothetical protein
MVITQCFIIYSALNIFDIDNLYGLQKNSEIKPTTQQLLKKQ